MTKHVVVVGGGVVGMSTALHLAERGHRVTVLDSGPRGGAGCSYGNAGMVVPSHFVPLAAPGMAGVGLRAMASRESPFYLKPSLRPELLSWMARFWRASTVERVERAAPLLRDLHFASRAIYAGWEASFSPGFELAQRGLLMLCNTEHGLAEEAKVAAMAHRLGVPAEVLTPAATAALEPNVTMDVAGAVYFPMDAHLSPGRLMAALGAALRKAGGTIQEETAVSGFRRQGRRVISATTAGVEMEADEFVLAAGFSSTAVAKGLGFAMPMQAGKGYSLTLDEPRRLPKMCAILSEARVAVTPMERALRVGGTMELGVADESIDPRRVAGIVKSFVRYFPDFKAEDFAGKTPWCGHRPCSPDGLPYVGRLARFDNLIAATGHSMMGVSLAPITGRLVAEIVSGEPPSIDIAALSPDRYR